MSTLRNILSITLCLFCSSLYAQTPNENQSQWNFALGSGAMADSKAWKGTDTENAFDALFRANIGNWHFGGDSLVAYQADVSNWSSFYVGVGERSEGYDSSDFTSNNVSESIVFKGYKEPDSETVMNYGVSFDWLAIDASTDISSNSEADTLSLTVEIPVYKGKSGFSVSTSASAHWVDANYVNYHYGVSESQVDNSVGRSLYQAKSALNYGVSVSATYPLNKQWMVLGELSHLSLADEISDSPLIDSDNQDALALLAIYQF